MTTFDAIRVRRLAAADRDAARGLAEGCGVAGVYVVNSLANPHRDDRLLGVRGSDDELVGLAWIGVRGNLIVLERSPLEPEPMASALADVPGVGWRVALGPDPIVRELAVRERQTPLVDRPQVYYGVRELNSEVDTSAVRAAVRADTKALAAASLDLSESDLRVPAWRVHKGWLRESVRRRVRDGRTFVIGPVGDPLCKLDIGSRGSGGVVIEGVYTRRGRRGHGLATSLVAGVIARLLAQGASLVCLHVAAGNGPARAAYERAGMIESGVCRLLLRD